MSDRAHLTSLSFGAALKEALFKEKYTKKHFSKDFFAGITVGIIAIPLSMALAVAVDAPPQYGLYTGIIAGIIIALTGGSRFSISGPTAAFVVILQPVVYTYGLGGLLVATLMAGLILIAMAIARLGRFIEYIPDSVTLGFTAGIAIVIATLQIKDFFGLPTGDLPPSFIGKLQLLITHLPQLSWPTLITGAVTLAVLILWPRLRTPVPGHLPAVVIGVVASLILGKYGHTVDTIGSRFTFLFPDGSTGQGIPPFLPSFKFPWLWETPGGEALWSFDVLTALVPVAFSIAMLGAIESLLCAVILDGMSGKRHSANGELLGQGLGNVVAPFFGGFAATAALARSAANYRAGAVSPLSAIIHSLVLLLSVLVLARWLSYLPMASMAALLLIVAWNMSEARKVVNLIKRAPVQDIMVLVVCLSLTVLVDMVIAISVGVVLASLVFMQQIAEMTRITDVSDQQKITQGAEIPEGWRIIKINGPLFFAAADRVFSKLTRMSKEHEGLVLYMDAVPLLDAGGLSAFLKFVEYTRNNGVELIVADLQFQPLRTLARANVQPIPGELTFTPTLTEAVDMLTIK
ncbi:MAG TPA: C4-dicarboxylic acid transporter DauA [Alcanivoracaceae bacterium]|nr:C4-dicarboxylic acid transporter DauA [Alcanivoracaceae bacterium]